MYVTAQEHQVVNEPHQEVVSNNAQPQPPVRTRMEARPDPQPTTRTYPTAGQARTTGPCPNPDPGQGGQGTEQELAWPNDAGK